MVSLPFCPKEANDSSSFVLTCFSCEESLQGQYGAVEDTQCTVFILHVHMKHTTMLQVSNCAEGCKEHISLLLNSTTQRSSLTEEVMS